MSEESDAFEAWRSAVIEYEGAVDELSALAELKGQGDPSIPLLVLSSDRELSSAVQRELDARESGRSV